MARSTLARLVAKVAVGALAVVTPVALAPVAAQAAAGDLLISEYVEGTGVNKAIEIYNGTGAPVDLGAGGYRLELYSNGSATATLANLTGAIADGDVFVAANGGANPTILAVTDLITNAVANWNGDDAIVLRKGGVNGTVVDAFGQIGTRPSTEWGTGLTSTADNTLRRKDTVCVGDTDGSNAFDPATEWDGFAVDTFDGLGAHTTACSVPEAAPAVASTTPANGATATAGMNLTVTFTEPVTLAPDAITLLCSITGPVAVTVTGGPTTFTVDPATSLADTESCTLTVAATGVSDQDSNDLPDQLTTDFSTSFTVADLCVAPTVTIGSVQGSGDATPVGGQSSTVRGVVVGDYEGNTPGLRGFYLQDEGDSDPATSDGIFIFNGGNQNLVEIGDRVAVKGTAGENQGQTQISTSAANITVCGAGTGSVEPVGVTLPMASPTDFEKYEGMLVETTQPLYVTEHFQLGRFGQIVVSSGGRLQQPTNVVAPGADALALQAQNNLNRLIIDDASQGQNPDPIVFARGGNPLSATNTLRGGDLLTEAVGVMTYTWGGNAASPNAYRLRPVGALDASFDVEAANERPAAPGEVGGDVRVAAMNLLNYFNTFDGLPDNADNCTLGVDGGSTDCRGADDQEEFDRQWPKTVAAILAVDADVLGVNEIENDGYGSDSSLAHLVDQLNAKAGAGTYAYLDVDAGTGQTNALGTDAIKVGMLYKPAAVTPIGQTAALNTPEFVGGGDTAPRSRPSLAQAFQVNATGGSFVADVNHLKSKGSACTVPDAGDGQGNCNASRTVSAQALATWLDTDPTGTGEKDVLILGDLNSYAMEDPITVLKNAGYTNLVSSFLGEDAYSYVFDGQWGYLDHALGSADLFGKNQVAGVAEFHINADEPSVLDYNTDFKTANLQDVLYAPDMFRVSDHDPIIVGLTPNSPATVEAAFDDTSVSCGAGSASLTVDIADRDDADTHEVKIAWGDGTTETVNTASDSLTGTRTHTYAAAGRYTATVTVTDSHGHVTTTTADVAVEFTTTGVLAPFKKGSVTAKQGSTVPVKVELADCDGSEPTDLDPTLTVSQGSTVARTATLVYVDGKWQHNLSTAGLAPGSYTVTITVPDTGQTITATLVVRR